MFNATTILCVRWYECYKGFVKSKGCAAEQGDTEAQYNLGIFYYKGLGIPEDYVQVYAWSDIAAAGGYQSAQNLRDMIGAKLNPTQLKKARKLAKELWEKYGKKAKN